MLFVRVFFIKEDLAPRAIHDAMVEIRVPVCRKVCEMKPMLDVQEKREKLAVYCSCRSVRCRSSYATGATGATGATVAAPPTASAVTSPFVAFNLDGQSFEICPASPH